MVSEVEDNLEDEVEYPIATPIFNALIKTLLHDEILDIEPILSLIEKSKNVNEVDDEGSTPLHYAVGMDLRLVQHLIKYGADVSLKDHLGGTALHSAAPAGSRRSGRKLQIYEIYKPLLERGANCTESDSERTALHGALLFQDLEVIKLLLEYGADLKAMSRLGDTAIHFAARNPNVNVIGFVLDQGFDIECTDREGLSPLQIAVTSSNFKGCKFLLKRGAMMTNFRNGITPLNYAILMSNMDKESERKNTVRILLEFGANIADKSGDMSALEIAATYRQRMGQRGLLVGGTKGIRNVLMRHVAMLQFTDNMSITDDDQRTIEKYHCYNEYHRLCLQELEYTKAMKFYGNVSIFGVSMECRSVICKYARNEELVEALRKIDYENEFPIYSAYLKKKFKRFYAEAKKQRLRNTAAKVLSKLLEFNDLTHQVNQKILTYLRDEDLHFLIGDQ